MIKKYKKKYRVLFKKKKKIVQKYLHILNKFIESMVLVIYPLIAQSKNFEADFKRIIELFYSDHTATSV